VDPVWTPPPNMLIKKNIKKLVNIIGILVIRARTAVIWKNGNVSIGKAV
jgi:hypothetical protein